MYRTIWTTYMFILVDSNSKFSIHQPKKEKKTKNYYIRQNYRLFNTFRLFSTVFTLSSFIFARLMKPLHLRKSIE